MEGGRRPVGGRGRRSTCSCRRAPAVVGCSGSGFAVAFVVQRRDPSVGHVPGDETRDLRCVDGCLRRSLLISQPSGLMAAARRQLDCGMNPQRRQQFTMT